MAMDYNTFVATIANITALDPTQPEFVQILPEAIAYSESRIYREIDLINTVYINASSSLTALNRSFTLPSAPYGNFLTVQGINILYGSGPQRQQLQPVAMSYLNAVWGSPTGAALPEYFAMVQQDVLQVGPWPDQSYLVEVIGTFQPEPLSATNTQTQLTIYLPDLFIAGAMVFMSGYMRDFGSQSDNPAQAMSWSNQYDLLFKSANLLELRKKFVGVGWTSLSSIPVVPTR
jgi:hypothetical protein